MSDSALKIYDAFMFLAMFVGVPTVSGTIGYAAWKGKPKTFSRDMYITVFLCGTILSTALYLYLKGLHADVRDWLFLWQSLLLFVLILILGVTFGCGIGFLTYRRSGPRS